jgi:oxalate decarboxylase/phosphoglucose isomerase-like protein (cupin superfamily)
VVSALVRRNRGHYVENTGDADLVFIETLRSEHYEEVSLANWLSQLPPKLVSAHLNILEEPSRRFPAARRESCRWHSRVHGVMPAALALRLGPAR